MTDGGRQARVTAFRSPGNGAPAITWLVLAREVQSVTVRGADRLSSVMVLDVDSGLVRGVGVEATVDRALDIAFESALTRPAAELPPGPPTQVLCPPGLAREAQAALTRSGVSSPPPITEVEPGPDAEDIFDSFLGHLAGRAQPDEFPEPEDWQLLAQRAADFRRTEPWNRWSDEQDLLVELQFNEGSVPFAAVVMGQAGYQRGLVLYPGSEPPAWLREDRAPQDAPPPPEGTLLLTLNPADELPVELSAKARRYGWPEDDELVPAFLAITDEGGADISRPEAHLLTACLSAVLDLDRRGLTSAAKSGTPTRGSVVLADGQIVRYEVTHRPPTSDSPQSGLSFHVAGHDLIPVGTPVSLGHLSWDALAGLRAAAQVHRPAPANAPEPAGAELPLFVTCPSPEQGPALCARIAELDPYGVSAVDAPDGEVVLVLSGGHGSEILMTVPAENPSLSLYRRRLRATKGRHVVMVADASTSSGEGAVYGLFECHQPLSPRRPARKATKRKPRKRKR